MNKTLPLISVIMPVYNTAGYLSASIGSLQAQDYKQWELLAVDDGSTDDSYQQLLTLSSNDQRIKPFHKTNEGIAKSRAFGLRHASGQYVYYLDSDDTLAPNTLSSCVEAIKLNLCDAALPNLIMELPSGERKDSFATAGLSAGVVLPGAEAFIRSIAWDGIHSSMMCRADLYIRIATNNSYLHDDYASDELITRRVLLSCNRVALCGGTYFYACNTDSSSRKISPIIFGKLRTQLRLIDICTEYGLSISAIAKAETTALRDMIDLWHTFSQNRQTFSVKQQHNIIHHFKYFYRHLSKHNIRHLLHLKGGITPKLQSMLLTYSWTLCKTALSLSESWGKENKLYPYFPNELINSLQ